MKFLHFVKHKVSHPMLAEFSHLKTLKSPSKSTKGSSSLFQQFANSDTPFDSLCQESLEEDILLEDGEHVSYQDCDIEDDISEEQKQELVEEIKDMGRTGLTPLARLPSTTISSACPMSGLAVSNTAIGAEIGRKVQPHDESADANCGGGVERNLRAL